MSDFYSTTRRGILYALLCALLIVPGNGFAPIVSSPHNSKPTTNNNDGRRYHGRQQQVRELLRLLDSSVQIFLNEYSSADLSEDEVINLQPVVDACFALATGVVTTQLELVPKKEQQYEATAEELLTHFFTVSLWDTELQCLAHSVREHATATTSITTKSTVGYQEVTEKLSRRVMEAADIMAASAKFILSTDVDQTATLDDLDTAVNDLDFLEARKVAILLCSSRHHINHQPSENSITEKDVWVVEALYKFTIQQLGPRFLTSLGFPSTKLGLRGFVAATRTGTNTQRAASALGRIWHASADAGPLIVVPNPVADECVELNGIQSLKDYTLVVAFSALGWNGIVRPEWKGTISNSPNVVLVHAIDSCKSWFTTNPLTGAADNGCWWDTTLSDLAAPFGRVCLVGESMGGTGALRFSQHATKSGTVVAIVPQINLNDFPSFSVRNDFDRDQKDLLLESIQKSFEVNDNGSSARVVIHVGRNPDDLRQLLYNESSIRDHTAIGLQVDAPLPRYSIKSSQTVGNCRLRIVKHDVEGHAVGAGLKAKGTLQKIVLDDLLGTALWQ